MDTLVILRVADRRIVDLAAHRIARRAQGCSNLVALSVNLLDAESKDIRRQYVAAFQRLPAFKCHGRFALVRVHKVQLFVVVGLLNIESPVPIVADLHYYHILLCGYRDPVRILAGLLHHIGVDANIRKRIRNLAELDLVEGISAVLDRLYFLQDGLAFSILCRFVQREVELVCRCQRTSVQRLFAAQRDIAFRFICIDKLSILAGLVSYRADRPVAVVRQRHGYRHVFRRVRHAAKFVCLFRHYFMDRIRLRRSLRQTCRFIYIQVIQRVRNLIKDNAAVRRVRRRLQYIAALLQLKAEFALCQFAPCQALHCVKYNLAFRFIRVLKVELRTVVARLRDLQRAVSIIFNLHTHRVGLRVDRHAIAIRAGLLYHVGVLTNILQRILDRRIADLARSIVRSGPRVRSIADLKLELAGLQLATFYGLRTGKGHTVFRLVRVHKVQSLRIAAVFRCQCSVTVVDDHHRHFILSRIDRDAVSVGAGFLHRIHMLAGVVHCRRRRLVQRVGDLLKCNLAFRIVRHRLDDFAILAYREGKLFGLKVLVLQRLRTLEGNLSLCRIGVGDCVVIGPGSAGV